MHPPRISRDGFGREAFAYLAIILLVLTTFYVSYRISLEREWNHGIKEGSILSDMKSDLDRTISSLRYELITVHDQVLMEVEKEMEENGEDARLDGALEGQMIPRLEVELDDLVGKAAPDTASFTVDVTNWTVDSRPILGGIDTAVPGVGDVNGSGLSDLANGTQVLGVNTSIHVQLSIHDRPGTLTVNDDLDLEVRRLSLSTFAMGRSHRFETALNDGELSGLVGYLIGSLAQMKCMMGYGRDPTEGEIAPISLLSENELLSCMDLAVALISQEHLRVSDDQFLRGIGEQLSRSPGAVGDAVNFTDILANRSRPMDPAMALMLGEGLFNENNPPSLETMIRPLFSSIVDLVVTKLISYMGMDDELLERVGGLKAVFDLGVEAVNGLSRSLLGNEVIGSARATAAEIFYELLRRSPLLDPDSDNIMLRRIEGVIWNGSSIDSYPMITIPPLERDFEIGLSDGEPEDIFYIAPNGTPHSKADYYDPSEAFYGAVCSVYRVDARYTFDPMEPPFNSRNLRNSTDFIRALSYFLGTEGGTEDVTGLEETLREKGRTAIRRVTEGIFKDLGEGIGNTWSNMWKGWNSSSVPSLDEDTPPLNRMISLQAGPLMKLAGTFADSLLRELDAVDFLSSMMGLEDGYADLIGEWISMNYDRWAVRDAQMDSCRENMTDILFGNCTVEILNVEKIETDVLYTGFFLWGGKDNVSCLEDYSVFPKALGLGLAPAYDMDPELFSLWSSGVSRSYSEVGAREFNDGSDGRGIGIIRKELEAPVTRGFDLTFSSYNGNRFNLTEEVNSLLDGMLEEVGDSFSMEVAETGGRVFIPPFRDSGTLKVTGIDRSGLSLKSIRQELKLRRSPSFSAGIHPKGGVYNTDIRNVTPPYSTDYIVVLRGNYLMNYSVGTGGTERFRSVERTFSLDQEVPVTVRSPWPMLGVKYEKVGTFAEYLVDSALEARDRLIAGLNDLASDVLGDTMSSLREVPPIIIDLVKGRDLDLTEIARVVSNVTLDLSSTVRETVKGLIESVIGLGLSGFLNATCGLLGIDEIDIALRMGAFDLDLHSDRRALTGGEGNLLNITLDLDPIGMHCFMSFNRLDDGSFDFNGTVTFDIGPLFLRLELDPFMMRAPHMISIEVRFLTAGGSSVRASFEIPALEEHRSCQISLGDSLGVEPFIPIPPLGIQAVLDAGFRLNYRMPEELGPHLNEVLVRSGNVTRVELFNPRCMPVYGSTLCLESPDGGEILSWRLGSDPARFMLENLSMENLWRWTGSIPDDGKVRLVLRSPSGLILDDVDADLHRSGWLSRDADGFGIWDHIQGTPGYENGGSLPTDIRALLISIALTSISEAWQEAYAAYGLTFDVVAPFLERAIDLFMARFLSVVRELVIDVRMFLSVEIEDASGTAGGGLEISFQADGEVVADFLGWLYDNIKVFIRNLADPKGAGDYRVFPMEILSRCYIGLDLFMDVEMPGPIEKMAPEGTDLPASFMLAICAKVNLAVPMKILGMDVGGGMISLGVYIRDAPDAIVSLFYDIGSIGLQQDFYLLRVAIWEESG